MTNASDKVPGGILQDLRSRLGLILALAMLPLLAFSIWKSFTDFTRDKDLLRKNIDLTASISLNETVNSFDTTKSILKFTAIFLEDSDCANDIDRVTQAHPRFYNIIHADPAGNIVCSAQPVRSSVVQNKAVLAKLSEDNPFTVSVMRFPSSNGKPKRVIATAHGLYSNGKLVDVLIAVEDMDFLMSLLERSKVSKSSELAVFGKSGEILGGQWQGGDLKSVAQDLPAKTFDDRLATTDAFGRDLLILPTPAEGIYIAIATAKPDSIFGNNYNPLINAAIPLLAWLFGFVAIWLSTDKLILIHIRRMRRAALQFAEGNRSARVGKLNDPPASILALGKNFDEMADRIIEREATIVDSLAEKETLLREIHHRVKNNLQIIISLLNMQERKLKDKEGLAAIVETRSRINAIALVHKGLYESDDLRFVEMQTFLDSLLQELAVAFGLDERGIYITGRVDCDPMEADTATPVALFIVEAMTNSVKHGVSGGGAIRISIQQKGSDVAVSVADSGIHTAESQNPEGGIGTKLMKGFARQLGGTLSRTSSESGYEIGLFFTPTTQHNEPL